GNISVLEAAGRREVARLPAPAAGVRGVNLRLSPDGRFLGAVYWFDHLVQFTLWELLEAGPGLKAGAAAPVGVFAFSADGRQLAVGLPDGSLTLHDLAGGGQRSLGPDRHAAIVAFCPDGRRLAFNSHHDLPGVRILDVETGQVVKTLPHPDDVKAL